MEIKDLKEDLSKVHSFSIKSELGRKPTILNASNSTNFVYQIDGLDEEDLWEIMDIDVDTEKNWLRLRVIKIMEKVNSNKIKIKYHSITSDNFTNNLKLIDSNLPVILSFIILDYYSTDISDIKTLTENLIEKNPLDISPEHCESFYKSKIIELIKGSIFGMKPDKIWNKEYSVDGGILNILKDGNILLHHIFYNKNHLDEYLYNNTKLDTPSCSRYDCGYLYPLNNSDSYYFDLNLQIRMK